MFVFVNFKYQKRSLTTDPTKILHLIVKLIIEGPALRFGGMRDGAQNRGGIRDTRNIEGGIRDEHILALLLHVNFLHGQISLFEAE